MCRAISGCVKGSPNIFVAAHPANEKFKRYADLLFAGGKVRASVLIPLISGLDSHSLAPVAGPMRSRLQYSRSGAGEGNRTLVCSLGSCRSAIELHPHFVTR